MTVQYFTDMKKYLDVYHEPADCRPTDNYKAIKVYFDSWIIHSERNAWIIAQVIWISNIIDVFDLST